ncbi:MAG: hypothetical protein DWQ04_26060 [Chloroflexi bacterium]|nr:MAG: hypothetical protein DWQ04_26060 [Chloroflexota bacterium]
MRKGIIFILIFILLLVAPSAVRFIQYYQLDGESRQMPTDFDLTQVKPVPTPETNDYVDEPQVGDGLILLDLAHNNQFTMDEIGYLDGRLSQRGFEFIPYEGGDLTAALRPVNAFVVMTPLINFTLDEIQAVSAFVDRGGRLLMIGDPTRFEVIFEETEFTFDVRFDTDKIPLNSLANEFDLIFNGDYLYNTVENEGNFRNILLGQDGFAENGLTDGLEKLAFYGAHSLQIGPTAEALLNGDDQTWSSATDRPGGLSLAATSRDGRVLALGDIQFMIAPYYTVYDNGRFISQIADFLTDQEQRKFVFVDFPYFYDDKINLVYVGSPDLGPDAFDEIITLQEAFRQVDLSLSLAAEAQDDHDTLYLGLYNQAEDVTKILEASGISLLIDPPIVVEEAEEPGEADTEPPIEEEETELDDPEAEKIEELRLIESSLGSVQMSGSSLIVLDDRDGRFNIIVLAASNQGLENTVNRLLQLIPFNAESAFDGCLLQDNLAICPTGITNEVVEAELITADGQESESEPNGEDAGDDEVLPDIELDAVNQGTIFIGDSVDGVLAENENHAWIFNSGPAVIDIMLAAGEDLDAILELYDPNNELLYSNDFALTGETEELLGIEIDADGDYTILIRDFYADGGSYTLTVNEGDPIVGQENVEGSIFIFSDDDGTPINDGVTSAASLAELLAPNYEVTTWISTLDGPLTDETLEEYPLVIWDTGDYEDEDGLFGEDTAVLLNYLDNGGDMFITGSAPALFSSFERVPLSTIQVNGDDPVLLENLTDGQIIDLQQTYDVVLSDFFIEDLEEGSIAFLLRGEDSEGAGSVVGLAAPADTYNNQNAVILLFPFVAMPTDMQTILVDNIMNWFEIVQQEG